jgi:hypothetical protein
MLTTKGARWTVDLAPWRIDAYLRCSRTAGVIGYGFASLTSLPRVKVSDDE